MNEKLTSQQNSSSSNHQSNASAYSKKQKTPLKERDKSQTNIFEEDSNEKINRNRPSDAEHD